MQWEGIFQYHDCEKAANLKASAGDDAGGDNIPSRGAEVRTKMWLRGQMEIFGAGEPVQAEGSGWRQR